jgi:membrane-bound lytic murein transglycosylase B
MKRPPMWSRPDRRLDPTHYFSYAVDYDGDGRRNLLGSPADVIGSTANYIANGLKWRRGEPRCNSPQQTHFV